MSVKREMEPKRVMGTVRGRLAIRISLLVEASWRLPNGSVAVLGYFLLFGFVSANCDFRNRTGFCRCGFECLTSLAPTNHGSDAFSVKAKFAVH